MAKKDKRRLNTYFRQTAKEFRAARQTQVYSHINRNLPYKIFEISKSQFLNKVKQVNIMKRKKLSSFGKHPFKIRKGKSFARTQKLPLPQK
jgi:hypothetical protein